MRRHRISDRDAMALLSNDPPAGRPDLDALGASLSQLRGAVSRDAPRPSAELASRLDLEQAASVLPARGSASWDAATEEVPASRARQRAPSRGKGRSVVGWVAGLGLAGKFVVGTSFAAAATAGAGAAGVLPPPVQDAYDSVVSTVLPPAGISGAPVETTESGQPTESTGGDRGEPGAVDPVGGSTRPPTPTPTPERTPPGQVVPGEVRQTPNVPGVGRDVAEDAAQQGHDRRQGAPHGQGGAAGEKGGGQSQNGGNVVKPDVPKPEVPGPGGRHDGGRR